MRNTFFGFHLKTHIMNYASIVQNFLLILKKTLMTGLKWEHHGLLKLQLFWCRQAVRPLGLCWLSVEVTNDVRTHYTTPSCTLSLGFKNCISSSTRLLGSQYIHWFLVGRKERENGGGGKHDPVQTNVKMKSVLVISCRKLSLSSLDCLLSRYNYLYFELVSLNYLQIFIESNCIIL